MNIMHMYYLSAALGVIVTASSCLMLYLTDRKVDTFDDTD